MLFSLLWAQDMWRAQMQQRQGVHQAGQQACVQLHDGSGAAAASAELVLPTLVDAFAVGLPQCKHTNILQCKC